MSRKTPTPAEVHNGWVVCHLGANLDNIEPKAIAGRTITAMEINRVETSYEEESDPHPQFTVVCHQGADWFVAALADTREQADIDFHHIIGSIDAGGVKE